MFGKVFCVIFIISVCGDEYDDNVQFVVFNDQKSFVSKFNEPVTGRDCPRTGKFSLISHGWMGSRDSWISDLIQNLIVYRTGCVIFMNYSYYSDNPNYLSVYNRFKPLSGILLKKLNQLKSEGVNGDAWFLYGFSFGGRLVIDAAIDYGIRLIDKIDTCDMAGPFFDIAYFRDPKTAAKNVQCIHTSVPAGTNTRNCHQNWLMGDCGMSQPASGGFSTLICGITRNCANTTLNSHSICTHFYNSAFKNDFKANMAINCKSTRLAKNLPPNFKMGYMETRRSSSIIGDIPSPTSKSYPYNVV